MIINGRNIEYTLRPEDVYETKVLCQGPPAGYEYTGDFRIPTSGDDWLARGGLHSNHGNYANDQGPRLILRKKKVKVVKFTFVGNRVAMRDEWYKCGHAYIQCNCRDTGAAVDVYSMEETEEAMP